MDFLQRMIFSKGHLLKWIVMGAWCILSPQVRAQMVVADYTALTNDRFKNDPSFFASAYDFSGVGRGSSGKWATMVSENVFISANHYHPAIGEALTFHLDNDPFGATLVRSVSGGVHIANSDVWVGWLDSPVSSGVASYTIPNYAAANVIQFSATPLSGATILTVGKSPGGNVGGVSNTNFVVGQNVIDGFDTGVSVGSVVNDVTRWIQDIPSDANKVLYESLLQSGDSGAPSFYVDLTGQMQVEGLHFSVGSLLIYGKKREASYDTYLPNFKQDIESQILLHSISVPEPSAVSLFCVALGGLLLRRKK